MRCSRCVSAIAGVLLVLFCTIGVRVLTAGAPTTVYLPAVSACPAPTATPDPNALLEQRIGDLINAARAAHGLPPLARAGELAQAARRHSADMAGNDFCDHVGSDGSTPGGRIEAAGYVWYACGENIAAGHATAEDVVKAWLDSDGHRATILSSAYQDMGVGYAYNAASRYVRYYAVDFASRQSR